MFLYFSRMTEKPFCVFQFIALTIFGLLLKIINLVICIKLSHCIDYISRMIRFIILDSTMKDIE